MKIFKIFLLAVMCLNCAGCFQVESNLKITDNGEVTMRNKLIGAPLIAGIIEEFKNNMLKNNPNAIIIKVREGGFNGYEIEIFYPTLDEFAANNIDMYQARPGKCTGVQVSDGFFYDSCNFDLLFEGREIDTSLAMTQALLAQVKFDFAVELPYATENSNADYMSNDGKILTWNIAPNLINGQNKSIKFSFKIYHVLRIAATFFLVLVIVAGVIYNLSQSVKKKISKDDFEQMHEKFKNQ